MPTDQLPEPWLSLLRELDLRANTELKLVCIGGFAVTVGYGAPRTTADLDVLGMFHDPAGMAVLALAEKGGELQQRFGVAIDLVNVATPPYNYGERLRELFQGMHICLRLFVPDACDLALLKLQRNSQRDREDVKWLARAESFEMGEMRRRYWEELRPYLTGPVERHDLTLKLWIEMIEEDRG